MSDPIMIGDGSARVTYDDEHLRVVVQGYVHATWPRTDGVPGHRDAQICAIGYRKVWEVATDKAKGDAKGRWVEIPEGPTLWIPWSTPVKIGDAYSDARSPHKSYLEVAGLDRISCMLSVADLRSLLDSGNQ